MAEPTLAIATTVYNTRRLPRTAAALDWPLRARLRPRILWLSKEIKVRFHGFLFLNRGESLSIELDLSTSNIPHSFLKSQRNLMRLSLLYTQHGLIGLGTLMSPVQGDDAQSFVGCQGLSQCYTHFNSAPFQAQGVRSRAE